MHSHHPYDVLRADVQTDGSLTICVSANLLVDNMTHHTGKLCVLVAVYSAYCGGVIVTNGFEPLVITEHGNKQHVMLSH